MVFVYSKSNLPTNTCLPTGTDQVAPPLWLLIIGQKRTGKSSVGNTILGKDAFNTWGGADSAVAHGESEGRQLMVVDACGWGTNEKLVPKQEKLELFNAFRGLAVIPNHSQKGGLHVNNTLLKLVYHS
uniref:AIG1-type G domain-containing protein n=1 Tax=Sinocyclocheilus grahami TaxID=75366 RepID=A0A672SH19_SINGR